jgi:hypothetical protein
MPTAVKDITATRERITNRYRNEREALMTGMVIDADGDRVIRIDPNNKEQLIKWVRARALNGSAVQCDWFTELTGEGIDACDSAYALADEMGDRVEEDMRGLNHVEARERVLYAFLPWTLQRDILRHARELFPDPVPAFVHGEYVAAGGDRPQYPTEDRDAS